MTEKFGLCRRCKGSGAECIGCSGTGFSGDVQDYLNPGYALRSPRKKREQKRSPQEVMEIVLKAIKGKTKVK